MGKDLGAQENLPEESVQIARIDLETEIWQLPYKLVAIIKRNGRFDEKQA